MACLWVDAPASRCDLETVSHPVQSRAPLAQVRPHGWAPLSATSCCYPFGEDLTGVGVRNVSVNTKIQSMPKKQLRSSGACLPTHLRHVLIAGVVLSGTALPATGQTATGASRPAEVEGKRVSETGSPSSASPRPEAAPAGGRGQAAPVGPIRQAPPSDGGGVGQSPPPGGQPAGAATKSATDGEPAPARDAATPGKIDGGRAQSEPTAPAQGTPPRGGNPESSEGKNAGGATAKEGESPGVVPSPAGHQQSSPLVFWGAVIGSIAVGLAGGAFFVHRRGRQPLPVVESESDLAQCLNRALGALVAWGEELSGATVRPGDAALLGSTAVREAVAVGANADLELLASVGVSGYSELSQAATALGRLAVAIRTPQRKGSGAYWTLAVELAEAAQSAVSPSGGEPEGSSTSSDQSAAVVPVRLAVALEDLARAGVRSGQSQLTTARVAQHAESTLAHAEAGAKPGTSASALVQAERSRRARLRPPAMGEPARAPGERALAFSEAARRTLAGPSAPDARVSAVVEVEWAQANLAALEVGELSTMIGPDGAISGGFIADDAGRHAAAQGLTTASLSTVAGDTALPWRTRLRAAQLQLRWSVAAAGQMNLREDSRVVESVALALRVLGEPQLGGSEELRESQHGSECTSLLPTLRWLELSNFVKEFEQSLGEVASGSDSLVLGMVGQGEESCSRALVALGRCVALASRQPDLVPSMDALERVWESIEDALEGAAPKLPIDSLADAARVAHAECRVRFNGSPPDVGLGVVPGVIVEPRPDLPPNLCVVPIFEPLTLDEGGSASVCRGLRLIDLSATKLEDRAAEFGALQVDIRVAGEVLQQCGLFGLPTGPYAVPVRLQAHSVQLSAGEGVVSVDCLQLAELRFEGCHEVGVNQEVVIEVAKSWGEDAGIAKYRLVLPLDRRYAIVPTRGTYEGTHWQQGAGANLRSFLARFDEFVIALLGACEDPERLELFDSIVRVLTRELGTRGQVDWAVGVGRVDAGFTDPYIGSGFADSLPAVGESGVAQGLRAVARDFHAGGRNADRVVERWGALCQPSEEATSVACKLIADPELARARQVLKGGGIVVEDWKPIPPAPPQHPRQQEVSLHSPLEAAASSAVISPTPQPTLGEIAYSSDRSCAAIESLFERLNALHRNVSKLEIRGRHCTGGKVVGSHWRAAMHSLSNLEVTESGHPEAAREVAYLKHVIGALPHD